jgi:hypothetical protein
MSAACFISSASTPRRPAVSMMTTSCCCRRAFLDAVARDLHRVADAVAGLGGEDRDAGLLADDLELVDGVGALQVGSDQQRRVPFALEPLGELARERRLTGALEAGEHDDGRRVLGELQPALSRHRGS